MISDIVGLDPDSRLGETGLLFNLHPLTTSIRPYPGGTAMDIKILGTGCVNCKHLETLTRAALDELGLTVEIDKVSYPSDR